MPLCFKLLQLLTVASMAAVKLQLTWQNKAITHTTHHNQNANMACSAHYVKVGSTKNLLGICFDCFFNSYLQCQHDD